MIRPWGACISRAHCETCRTDRAWRATVVRAGIADEVDFECPRGLPLGWRPSLLARLWSHWRRVWQTPSRGLGDTVAKMTQTVGIRPCGGCAKRKHKLNKLIPYGDAGEQS